jgi:uncharacterized protein with PQ loop repeat
MSSEINCEECKKKCEKKELTTGLFSTVEIIGWAAIGLGVIGAFFQLRKSGGSKDLSSFSVFYLAFAVGSEILMLIQGLMIKNASIALTRLGTTLYFGGFLVMWFLYEWKKKK